jgi:hypothetical protein
MSGKAKDASIIATRALAKTGAASRVAVEKANAAMESLPAIRGQDGRSLRRTGRDMFFGTNITPELKQWLKIESARIGEPIGRLFELMRGAYEREEESKKK